MSNSIISEVMAVHQLNDSPEEKALQLLKQHLTPHAMTQFEALSHEMATLFQTHPTPTMETVEAIITTHFRSGNVSKEITDKFFAHARAHATQYGIPEEGMPIAVLADFGMFRFLEFLRGEQVPDEVIFQIFSGAAQGGGEGTISLWGM